MHNLETNLNSDPLLLGLLFLLGRKLVVITLWSLLNILSQNDRKFHLQTTFKDKMTKNKTLVFNILRRIPYFFLYFLQPFPLAQT